MDNAPCSIILGRDFLCSNKLVIDFETDTLRGENLNCSLKEGEFSVRCKEEITIPPCSDILVPISFNMKCANDKAFLVTTIEAGREDNHLLSTHNSSHILLCNTTNEELKIDSGAEVGNASVIPLSNVRNLHIKPLKMIGRVFERVTQNHCEG